VGKPGRKRRVRRADDARDLAGALIVRTVSAEDLAELNRPVLAAADRLAEQRRAADARVSQPAPSGEYITSTSTTNPWWSR
jgi:hypothetical protein